MKRGTNAKDEFLEATKNYKVIAAVISFGNNYYGGDKNEFKLNPLYTNEEYNDFLKFLNREYDAGYGGQELYGTIFCEDGVWMDRGEYDGSEWYDVHKYPDMIGHFDENKVLKYNRYNKLKHLNNSIG
jgi:hypothetical protein